MLFEILPPPSKPLHSVYALTAIVTLKSSREDKAHLFSKLKLHDIWLWRCT